MLLTDTHIHLYAEEFGHDFPVLFKEARGKNIGRFFIPNIDSSTMDAMFGICALNPGVCFPMLGLHPCYIKENFMEELRSIRQRAETEKIVAVGEIGIDLYWDKNFFSQQEEAFIIQMEWAKEWNLPIVIHSRDATDEIIRIIGSNRHLNPRGIFHCFSGNLEQAEKIISLGFFLGIGGVLTFKNSGLDKVVEATDLSHIVLETDAPYLAPAPHRGKRNEPSFLYLVAEKLAAIKNLTVEEVASVTTGNSKTVFSL